MRSESLKKAICASLLSALGTIQCGTDNSAETASSSDPVTDTGDNVDAAVDEGRTGIFADVSRVHVSGEPEAYSFSVTIESADIDCTQYADWWEVITDTGELVFRRILTHSHTDDNGTGNPFTRDGTPVPVTSDQIVIVRAHMNNAGYAGKVMRGSVYDGFVDAPDIDSAFAETLENAPPQPEGCLF